MMKKALNKSGSDSVKILFFCVHCVLSCAIKVSLSIANWITRTARLRPHECYNEVNRPGQTLARLQTQ